MAFSVTLPIEPASPFIPQSSEMALLDRITDFGEDFLVAEASIGQQHILLQNGKLATYSGVEIMAQGIAAWAGIMAKQRNEPIRLGYLLGTRKLYIHQPDIAVGTVLEIRVKMSIQDATGFGVFDCQLIDKQSQKVLLEGALNVFSPKDGKIQK